MPVEVHAALQRARFINRVRSSSQPRELAEARSASYARFAKLSKLGGVGRETCVWARCLAASSCDCAEARICSATTSRVSAARSAESSRDDDRVRSQVHPPATAATTPSTSRVTPRAVDPSATAATPAAAMTPPPTSRGRRGSSRRLVLRDAESLDLSDEGLIDRWD